MQTIHQTHRLPGRPAPLLRAATCLFALACVVAATAPVAQAKTKENGKPANVSVAKAKKPGKVKFENGSSETTAERDRRLLRECKGRPNAGACLGYTG